MSNFSESIFEEKQETETDGSFKLTHKDWVAIKERFNHSLETIYFYSEDEHKILFLLHTAMERFDNHGILEEREVVLINNSPKFFDVLYLNYAEQKQRDITHEITARYKGWLRGFLDKVESVVVQNAKTELKHEEEIPFGIGSVFG